MKFNNRVEALGFAATLAVAFLLIFSPIISESQAPTGMFSDGFHVRGAVKVYRDGVLVAENHNVIVVIHYDVIACKVYNSTDGCSTAGFSNNTIDRALNGIGLSTSSSTPSSGTATCPSYISGSGLDAEVATVSHSANLNTISLSASWVANASVTNIQKACLFYVTGDTVNAGASQATYASTLFTAVNIANGQSLGITWTFSY